MKWAIYHTIFILATILCISCSSVHHLTIETQQPASIMFPPNVSKVIIANNSIAQPEGYGFELYLKNKKIDPPHSLGMDTVLWACTTILGNRIQDANYFSDALIYNNSLRSDDQWLRIEPISPDTVRRIYESSGADAVISVDRLFFIIAQRVTPRYENDSDPAVDIVLTSQLACSAYIPGRSKSLTSFTVSDSLHFSDLVFDNSLNIYKYLPLTLISESIETLCRKAADTFTPSWKMADRVFYSGFSSRMKEATSYAKTDKWVEARTIWESLYESKDNPKDKARLAANIALSYEMEDQLKIAFDWIKKSNSFYQQTKLKDTDREVEQAKLYSQSLEERLKNDWILDIQFEKKE